MAELAPEARVRARKGVDVAVVQRRPAAIDEVVLVPVVDAADDGAVAELLAQRGDLGVEVGAGDLAQAVLAKFRGDGLHLAGDGGVVVGGCGVVGSDLDQDEPVAMVLKVELELLRCGAVGVLKVHVREAAEAHGRLVHEAAGLAIVIVLGALAHLGERDRVDLVGAPKGLHGAAVGGLHGRGAGQAAAGRHRAGKGKVKAGGRAADGGDLVGHATHEGLGGPEFVLANGEAIERDGEGGEAIVGDADLVGAVRHGDAVHRDVERARDHVAALVVGVVAGDLGATRRVHVEDAGVGVDGAELVLEERAGAVEAGLVGDGGHGRFLSLLSAMAGVAAVRWGAVRSGAAPVGFSGGRSDRR